MENKSKKNEMEMDTISKKETRLMDFPENEENPFLANLVMPIKKKNVLIAKDNKILINTVTGEEEETLFLSQKKEVDNEQFIKIFHSQLQILFDLSKSSLKIFSYIASITRYDDKVLFNIEDCKKYTKYSSKETIYKGLAELINSDIIAKSITTNMYYINPSIFFKGDRMVLISDYRRPKKNINFKQL